MIPFAYRDYWDVPRIIVFEAEGALYCLDCKFSDELDDYPPDYRLFRLREHRRITELPNDWTSLTAGAVHLGNVPLARVKFDETRRRHIMMTVTELLDLAQP